MNRLRQIFSSLFQSFRWDRAAKRPTDADIENLAQSFADYARMQLHLNPHANAVVAVDELALRFRENRRVIRTVLYTLENQNRAKRLKLHDLWKLKL